MKFHFSQNRRVRACIFVLLLMTLTIPMGMQTGYADEGTAKTSPLSAPNKAAAPSVCDQPGFSNNTYTVGYAPFSIAMGDLNGDGKIDLATANYSGDNASVLLGNGNGTFMASVNYASGDTSYSIAIGDFFGDRIDDLAVAASNTGGVSYLQGEGDGTFSPPYSFDMGSEPDKVALGDFTGDGFPDIVTTSGASQNLSIRINDGVANFAAATHIALGVSVFDVEVGDFNGDSKADLVTTNLGVNNVSVLMGNGNGTFQAPINFGVGNFPLGAAIGDFNGDGNEDIVTANRYSNTVALLLGNGNGLFQSARYFTVGMEPTDVAIGDFNDDGKADVVSANGAADNVSVLLGNGSGSFYIGYNFSAGDAPSSVVAGDFNNDGKDDIATTNQDSNNVSVLLNTCVSLTNTPTPTSVPANTDTPTSTPTDTNTPLPTQTPGGPTATPPPACTIQFTDVPADNTFYTFVRCLACRGIISGYACGGAGEPCNQSNDPYFRPSNPVTRGQLAKIVANSAGFSEPVSGQTFEDVVPGSAFYPFVERLVAREVMGGYACGGAGEPCGSSNLPYFRPSSGATRGQLTKIVSNAAGFSDAAPGTYTFTDVPVGSTFHVYVERLLMNRPGVTGGYDCGGAVEPCDAQNRPYFRPANPLTRGQTSKIVGNTFFPNCQAQGK